MWFDIIKASRKEGKRINIMNKVKIILKDGDLLNVNEILDKWIDKFGLKRLPLRKELGNILTRFGKTQNIENVQGGTKTIVSRSFVNFYFRNDVKLKPYVMDKIGKIIAELREG